MFENKILPGSFIGRRSNWLKSGKDGSAERRDATRRDGRELQVCQARNSAGYAGSGCTQPIYSRANQDHLWREPDFSDSKRPPIQELQRPANLIVGRPFVQWYFAVGEQPGWANSAAYSRHICLTQPASPTHIERAALDLLPTLPCQAGELDGKLIQYGGTAAFLP